MLAGDVQRRAVSLTKACGVCARPVESGVAVDEGQRYVRWAVGLRVWYRRSWLAPSDAANERGSSGVQMHSRGTFLEYTRRNSKRRIVACGAKARAVRMPCVC